METYSFEEYPKHIQNKQIEESRSFQEEIDTREAHLLRFRSELYNINPPQIERLLQMRRIITQIVDIMNHNKDFLGAYNVHIDTAEYKTSTAFPQFKRRESDRIIGEYKTLNKSIEARIDDFRILADLKNEPVNKSKNSKKLLSAEEQRISDELDKHRWLNLDKVKSLSDESRDQLIREIAKHKLRVKMGLLHYIGFVEYINEESINSVSKSAEIFQRILAVESTRKRDIEGCIRAFDPNSPSGDKARYSLKPSSKKDEDVEKIYNSLK